MPYKLIATDMDGTLLDDANEVTPAVREAIKEAQSKGVYFTISTGRPIQGVERYLDLLDGDIPVISCNGALLITARTRHILMRSEISRTSASEILERGIREGAVVAAWSGGLLYSSEAGSAYSAFYKALSNMDSLDISLLPDTDVTKIVWIMTPERVIQLQKSYVPPAGVQSKSSGEYFLEFFSSEAGKDKALGVLAGQLGIDASETIAIGDNYNDIEMLRFAGLGVAMGNAPDEVKKFADIVTVSNNEDGVAQVIKQFVLSDSKNEL